MSTCHVTSPLSSALVPVCSVISQVDQPSSVDFHTRSKKRRMSDKTPEKKKKQVSKTLPKNTKAKTRSKSTSGRSLDILLARHPTLGVILEDLCRWVHQPTWENVWIPRSHFFLSRFVLNCPPEEYSSFDRIGFQLELAHWFYLDFYREEDLTLPNLPLKEFMCNSTFLLLIFHWQCFHSLFSSDTF